MENRAYLKGQWDLTFSFEDKTFKTKAEVPGNVEPVLQKIGLIDNYIPQDDQSATARFDTVNDWTYATSFDYEASADYEKYLVFEGIDTIAEIYLNGSLVLECENMHCTHRISLDKVAKNGKNDLCVIIRSSELWARKHPHDNYVLVHGATSFYDSMTYLRKSRHHWGWDNAPRLLTSGIYRPVYIETLKKERFTDLYVITESVDEDNVYILASWTYKTDEPDLSSYETVISLYDKDRAVSSVRCNISYIQGRQYLVIPRSKINLWWPINFGKPYMYQFSISMLKNGKTIDEYTIPFGVRELKFKMSEDTMDGEGEFDFYINGEKIFIKGTNWKPLDPLSSIADLKTKEERALEHVKALGCNMVRVWGGGIYENECFYDWCDRNGILVWQDFMLACEIPPLDVHYASLIEKEAEQIIKRYRNHPSLAVWCGDNENDASLTWRPAPSTLCPSDLDISRRVLKTAVLRYDPQRSYIPSSPYYSDRAFEDHFKENAEYFSIESHLYPDSVKFHEVLRNTKSIFIGETGPINVNSISTAKWARDLDAERAKRLWDAKEYDGHPAHQNDKYFARWRTEGAALCLDRYGRDFTFDEWDDYVVAINLACAEIFKDVIEYCRVSPRKSGVLWWSLMDMWPMMFNYSVMDCDYNPKLAYHFIKRSQADIAMIVTRLENGSDPTLYCSNATLDEKEVKYRLKAIDRHGREKILFSGEFIIGKNCSIKISDIRKVTEPELLIIEYYVDGKKYANHAFTGFGDYDTMKNWLLILSGELGFFSEMREKL